jgi:Leucine-rich repeat (LRR) protein
MKYKAFISYRHTEHGRRHAVALETALKRYAKPTLARPISIFRDEKHMKPDVSLPKLIREGLENSEYLIFLAEKPSAESQWCSEELEYWCSPANLKTLLLNGNKIKGLPDQLFHLQQLTVLDLSGNELVNLSPEIARLQNLQMLNLSGNEFVTLPVEAFKQMSNLKKLVLKEHWDDSNLTKEIVAALGKAMPWCEIAFYE